MELRAYDKIKESLQEFLTTHATQIGYDLSVVQEPPLDPVYPYVRVVEMRNQRMPGSRGQRDRVSSVAYHLRVFVKPEPAISPIQVAKRIFMLCNMHMERLGLYAIQTRGIDGNPYEYYGIFPATLLEDKEKFI